MSKKQRIAELRGKLKENQIRAAYLLVENEFQLHSKKRSLEELASELGITQMTLYRWRTEIPEFIEFKGLIADDFLATQRELVFGSLMKLIKAPTPSVKAIDLFMRKHGMLTDHKQIDINEGNGRSADDIKAQLKDLDDLLDD